MIGGSIADLFIRLFVDRQSLNAGFNAARPIVAAQGASLGMAFNKAFASTIGAFKMLALPVLLADSIRSLFAFEDKMRQVRINARLLGAEGAEAYEKIEAKARELASTTQFRPEQVADAMNVLSLAGLKANDILEGTPHILNMATAGNVSLARASEIATASMKMYNLEMKDMEAVADILVGTQSRARVEMSELSDAMLKLGPLGQKMGLSFDELAATLAIMGERSHSILTQADALKNAIIKLTDPSDKTSAQLKKLGINMEHFTKNGEIQILDLMDAFTKLGLSTQEINVLFRARGAQVVTLFQAINDEGLQGVEAVRALAKSVREDAGFAAIAAQYKMGSLLNQLRMLWSAFQDLSIELLGPVAESFRIWVAAVTKGIQAIIAFNKATGGFLSNILVITAQSLAASAAIRKLAAAMALLRGFMFGKTVAGAGGIPTFVKGWLTKGNIVIAIIVGVIAAIVGLFNKIKTSEGAVKAWQEAIKKLIFAWQTLKEFFGGLLGYIAGEFAAKFGGTFTGMKDAVVNFASKAISGFAEFILDAIEWSQVLAKKWKAIFENMYTSAAIQLLKLRQLFSGSATDAKLQKRIDALQAKLRDNANDVASMKNELEQARKKRMADWEKRAHDRLVGNSPPTQVRDGDAVAAKIADAISKVMDTHRSGFVEFGKKIQDALLNSVKEDRDAKMLAIAEASKTVQDGLLAETKKTNTLLSGMNTGLTEPA